MVYLVRTFTVLCMVYKVRTVSVLQIFDVLLYFVKPDIKHYVTG